MWFYGVWAKSCVLLRTEGQAAHYLILMEKMAR